MTESTPVIEMRHIIKNFDFAANDDINLQVNKVKFTLLGENSRKIDVDEHFDRITAAH